MIKIFSENRKSMALTLGYLSILIHLIIAPVFLGEPLPAYHPLKEERVVIERANKTSGQFGGAWSSNVGKKFEAVSDHFGNGELEQAMNILQAMHSWNLSKFERAYVYQFMGFIYVQQNNIDKAIEVFKKCIQLDSLSTFQHQSTLFNLASLYGAEENWDLTIESLMQWFEHEVDPVPEGYIMTGIAYFQKGNPLTALPYIHIANMKSIKPHENWFQLELAILFTNKQFDEAIEVLKKMATNWPEKEKYWETMAGVYMEIQRDPDALSALTLGYKNNAISKEKSLENLARLNLFLEIPYQAAVIVQENIDNGSLEKNEANLKLLLGSWTAAREFDEAIKVIDILAPMTNQGDLYIQKAMLLNEKGDWEGVRTAAKQALETGTIDKPGDVYILLGMAYTELEEYEQAIDSFEKVLEVGAERNKKNAEAWIEYVSDRQGS